MREFRFIGVLVFVCFGLLSGCNFNGSSDADKRAREEKTRDEVAKATERAKPMLEDAGRKIGKAAAEAADEAQAAAEGVREGWERGHRLVNVNTASEKRACWIARNQRPRCQKNCGRAPVCGQTRPGCERRDHGRQVSKNPRADFIEVRQRWANSSDRS